MMPFSRLQTFLSVTFASRTLLLRHTTQHITQLHCTVCSTGSSAGSTQLPAFTPQLWPLTRQSVRTYQGDSHQMGCRETSNLGVPLKFPAAFRFWSKSHHSNRHCRHLQSLVTVSLYKRVAVVCGVRAEAKRTVLILSQTARLKKQLSIE